MNQKMMDLVPIEQLKARTKIPEPAYALGYRAYLKDNEGKWVKIAENAHPIYPHWLAKRNIQVALVKQEQSELVEIWAKYHTTKAEVNKNVKNDYSVEEVEFSEKFAKKKRSSNFDIPVDKEYSSNWLSPVHSMFEAYGEEMTKKVANWAFSNDYWKNVLTYPGKLNRHFKTIAGQMGMKVQDNDILDSQDQYLGIIDEVLGEAQ